MQVGDIVSIAEGVVTQFIRCTMHHALFQSGPGHQDCESVRMMIASVDSAAPLFKAWCAAKFGAEYHDDVIQQPSLLQITQESCNRPVHRPAKACMIFFQLLMRIPDAVTRRIDLNEPDTAFHKPSCGQQALAGDFRGVLIQTIES